MVRSVLFAVGSMTIGAGLGFGGSCVVIGGCGAAGCSGAGEPRGGVRGLMTGFSTHGALCARAVDGVSGAGCVMTGGAASVIGAGVEVVATMAMGRSSCAMKFWW